MGVIFDVLYLLDNFLVDILWLKVCVGLLLLGENIFKTFSLNASRTVDLLVYRGFVEVLTPRNLKNPIIVTTSELYLGPT